MPVEEEGGKKAVKKDPGGRVAMPQISSLSTERGKEKLHGVAHVHTFGDEKGNQGRPGSQAQVNFGSCLKKM